MAQDAHPRSPRPLAPRLLLAAAGAFLGLVLCELGLRTYYSVQGALRAAEWRAVGATHHREGPVMLGHLIRPHADPKIIYELIPDLDLVFRGARVATNANGFRGPAYPQPAGEDVVRIVGLGDSVLFGWGVEYQDSYLPVLASLLAESHPGVAIEVINTAVPGYNTVMEVETLKLKGLAYRPDLVIIDHVGNDLAPPRFVPYRLDCWALSRSFLVDTVRAALRGESVASTHRFGPAPDFADDGEFWRMLEFDPQRVPEELRDLVGFASFQEAMGELADLAREHGFRVLVAIQYKASEYLREVCGELGLPLVEVDPRVVRYMEERDIAARFGPELTTGDAADMHPSPLAPRPPVPGGGDPPAPDRRRDLARAARTPAGGALTHFPGAVSSIASSSGFSGVSLRHAA